MRLIVCHEPHPMSHVTCHMSHVTCHMSRVTCHTPRSFQVLLQRGNSVSLTQRKAYSQYNPPPPPTCPQYTALTHSRYTRLSRLLAAAADVDQFRVLNVSLGSGFMFDFCCIVLCIAS